MPKGFVFNALKDTTLSLGGRDFHFPKGVTTIIEDQTFTSPDLYKRNHESEPDEAAVLSTTISGFDAATRMLNRHHMNRIMQGFWVGKEEPSKTVIAQCEVKAQRWKRQQIAGAQKERADRLANVPGRNELDPEILEWMQAFGIQDNVYNPQGGSMTPETIANIAAAAGVAAAKAIQETAGARK